ncbi:trigger factor [Acholeplasma hippikon]|uniref:Trigger factor n=1 Tax=Acholeplasma hippikon TaxID=264636 RepID=A0A449BIJ9_9MOLU|nr:trigger factor [Acholeplasma hippikon]VEU82279.1 Trigger factor [Acholeplasma hippikon]
MKFERINSNHVKFTFTVTPHEFEHALEHAFDHIKDDVEIKGFRKGHVTRKIYEQKFGAQSLWAEALNHAIGHKFQDAMLVKEFTIVSDPLNIDLDWNSISTEKDFEVSFEVAIKPEVTLGAYKGVEVAKVDSVVTTDEVKAEINSLLQMNADLEPKAEGLALEMGDTAIFDFEGFQDGVAFEGGKAENFSLQIGSGQFIPGFEEGMVGMNVGEERDVNVTFPEQYQAENLAGKPAVFKVKLHEIKVTKGAELNDEWVKSLNREGISTVAELEKSIEKDLQEQKSANAKNVLTDSVIKAVVANASLDVPQEMFDAEIENFKKNVENQAKQYQLDLPTFLQLSGLTEEAFEQQAKEQAERRVTQSLVIEAVAKAEGFTATEEELAARYQELANYYKMKVEEIKRYISDELVKNDIAFEKAVDFLVNSSIQK